MLRSHLSSRLASALGSARAPLALAALALVVRLPALFAGRHLTFDDGVFGASAVAMRHGGVPFREVFSSQGPLFLPLVWVFDLLGGRAEVAPRLLAVAAGVAVTVGVYALARQLSAKPSAAFVAAAVASTSGSLLWTSGPLAADGPGVALATVAVAVALSHRDRPSTAKAVALGALIGAAFAIKSLFAVPPGLAIAWVLLESRAWRHLLVAVSASAAVVLAAALPWGLAEVWDQAVRYHLDAADERTPGANARKVVSTLWDRDLLLLVAGAAAAGLSLAARLGAPRGRAGSAPGQRSTPGQSSTLGQGSGAFRRSGPVVVWLAAILLVLLLEHPLWRPHLVHVVPPAAALAALGASPAVRRFVAVVAVAALVHAAGVTGILWPGGYTGEAARAHRDLAALPGDALALSDEPGFVWRAGLRAPDDLVDASILRIEQGRITAASVSRAASDPRVCAVLVWSHRFGDLDLGPRLDGYEVTATYGGPRRLFVRPACAAPPGG